MRPTISSIFLLFIFLLLTGSSNTTWQEPDLMKGMVQRHNFWRSKVKVRPLEWSDELASFAQKWADELSSKGCEMKHRPRDGEWGSKYGENIYWSSGMNSNAPGVVDSWASEIQFYNARNGKCKGGVCGHYTQLVWSSSARVGCGMAKCGSEEIWVCNYDPPGNYQGQQAY